MCTASWSVGQERLSLCFNRDERKSRGEASGPITLERGGTRMIAAIDSDAGGTWLAVNEFGLCVFLLNNYGAQTLRAQPLENARSRGELPLRYASYLNQAEALGHLSDTRLVEYNPFILGFADVESVSLFSWDGENVEDLRNPSGIVTTSSHRTQEVESYRKSRYEGLKDAADKRRDFHVGTPHEDPAFNPMMLRVDSRTRSVSTIEIASHRVSYTYEAVLDETRQLAQAETVDLPRKSSLNSVF